MRTSLRKDGRPFRRVLVANRGEIALRVIRACRELDVETVAVYSDADVASRHVRAADVAVRIGPPPAAQSYLDVERIVAAALEHGAEAIHPGYGFLSERPALAEACAAAGIVFIGPEPATLIGLGDKLNARRAAAAVGVPVVPGTLEPVAVDRPHAVEAVLVEAERIGWPVLVKAAAGGGGRGMRLVERAADLPAALVAASHEALAAFGDGSVYLEHRLDGARHVEVQLLGDVQGTVVALGERDCSVQRRHQKLVEETPAPGFDEARRRALHGHGVAVARAVGLRNAATAEFLVGPDGNAWFLEVNARLQVEHGVTELVTGLDIVHEQLWIAAGRPLSDEVLAAAERAATPDRHAIEVRLSAEDPSRDFAPVPGTIGRWRTPGGPGVRMDDWVEDGTRIGGDYDNLIAKLLVVAEDRPAALARLRRALRELEVTGIQTTLPFDLWLVDEPHFRAGDLATDFVPRHWDPAPLRAAAANRAAQLAADGFADAGRDGLVADAAGAVRPPTPASGWASLGRREAIERWPK
jgi:acetyl/propionyl-CoA carboxylase alpha subunit